MKDRFPQCPDCHDVIREEAVDTTVSRRQFVQVLGATASLAAVPRVLSAAEEESPKPESLVTRLYNSLSELQQGQICFDWDHKVAGETRRQHVDNNWQVTRQRVASSFFTSDQQEMIEAIFWGLYNPDWKKSIARQLRDDAGGYGRRQSIAIFGKPGTDKFQFVMTGRHLTIRCDGNSAEHVAFGGPIFYGHAAQGFNEKPHHPGNVFWPQAVEANALYKMLDGKQRQQALIPKAPQWEGDVEFRGSAEKIMGLPISELSADQKEHAQKVLQKLVEPYRTSDQDEAMKCLKAQGGLDKCKISFYADEDVGNDGVWDTWRLEGPAFVWHFRGDPHVHVWVNVANDPGVEINTGNG